MGQKYNKRRHEVVFSEVLLLQDYARKFCIGTKNVMETAEQEESLLEWLTIVTVLWIWFKEELNSTPDFDCFCIWLKK